MNLKVVVPGKDEQQRTIDAMTAFEDRRRAETNCLHKLRLLKAGLMDDLLTGSVRVTVDSAVAARA